MGASNFMVSITAGISLRVIKYVSILAEKLFEIKPKNVNLD